MIKILPEDSGSVKSNHLADKQKKWKKNSPILTNNRPTSIEMGKNQKFLKLEVAQRKRKIHIQPETTSNKIL